MSFGGTIPSAVFPRKAKMSARGIENVILVGFCMSINFFHIKVHKNCAVSLAGIDSSHFEPFLDKSKER